MPYAYPQLLDQDRAHRSIRHLLPGACLLTGTAGYINSAVLGFYHTPVSHMTGAVSHLSLDIAEGRGRDSLASLSIILGFVLGSLVAGALIGAWKLVPGRRYGTAMMVQGGLLALATWLLAGQSRFGLPAVAMACGLQNAMASSYCGLMIRTTHVTGTVTDIGVILGHWLRHRQIQWWKLRFLLLLVLSFGVGGWLGALAELKYGLGCLGVVAAGTTLAGGAFWFVTHHGLVDLMQGAVPRPPTTGSFPDGAPRVD